MEYKEGKHRWEDEGWEAMEKLLDKDMPAHNGIWASRATQFAVVVLCLLSFGFWLLPNTSDWNKEKGGVEKSIAASADVSNYTLSSVSELSEVEINSNFGELSSSVPAMGSDVAFGVRYGSPIEFRHMTIESFFEDEISETVRRREAIFIPYDFGLATFNWNPALGAWSAHSEASPAIKPELNKKIYTFSELYYHNGSADLWGGGALVGVTYESEQPWRTSLSLGYQLTELPSVKANYSDFQPLVIPGSQSADQSSSANNNGVNMNLPDLQLLMHQINVNAQFEWRIFSRFAAGAVSRLSLNWYDVNPDLSDDPIRAFYPDLQYSKTEVKKTHIGVGAGLNIAYDMGCNWSIHTRGLFNKNFVGLNANTAIIKNQFWTFETGLRYRF